MSRRSASILSVILSLILLLVFAILTVILEMIAMNGATESQGMAALGTSLVCLGAGAILIGLLAWKAAGFFITRLHFNPILAVTLSVTLGMLASGVIAVFSLLISLPLAGIH